LSRPSTIESHPERTQIELARAAGVSLDRIAAKFGVGRDAVARHWKALTPEYRSALVMDIPREKLIERAVEESGSLLDHYKLHRNLVEQALIVAKGCGDFKAVANLGRAAIAANDAIGRLTGEIRALPGLIINNSNTTQINLLDTPAFKALEGGLLELAMRHPSAKDDIRSLVMRVRDMPEPRSIEAEAAHA
jgi:hypothetical protein